MLLQFAEIRAARDSEEPGRLRLVPGALAKRLNQRIALPPRIGAETEWFGEDFSAI